MVDQYLIIHTIDLKAHSNSAYALIVLCNLILDVIELLEKNFLFCVNLRFVGHHLGKLFFDRLFLVLGLLGVRRA